MELRVPHMLHLFNVFRENKDFDNCTQLLEEECIRMFVTKYVNDEHDCNVVSMNSLNIHDANDMQSHELGDAMFDEDVSGDIGLHEHLWGRSPLSVRRGRRMHKEQIEATHTHTQRFYP